MGSPGQRRRFILGASYGKRYDLPADERWYTQLPFTEMPAAYALSSSNPSEYFTVTPATFAASTPTAGIPTTTIVRDYTPATCTAIGGYRSGDKAPVLSTTNPALVDECGFSNQHTYNLVEEETYARGYGEFNADISDSLRIHAEVAYAKTVTPHVETVNSYPPGGNFAQLQGGGFSIPYRSPTYSVAGVANADCVATPTAAACTLNPYAQEFYNRAAANGNYTGARTALYTTNNGRWWPLNFGGNPLYPKGQHYDTQERERFGGAVTASGEFTKDGFFGRFLPEGTGFSYSAIYNQYSNVAKRPDWIVSRLQDAMNGYGGPGCKAIDRVPTNYATNQTYDATVGIQSDTAPGTNGCLYFNPFASSFKTSWFNGAANPSYGGASFENSTVLLDWIEHSRVFETINSALTFNATFTGRVPGFELPGGPIDWAAGTEWRQTETRGRPDSTLEELEIHQRRCAWNDPMTLAATTPGLAACYGDRGPFFGPGIPRQPPFFVDRQVNSFYGELQLPILDNLNVQLAGRSERFETITGNIWKIAAKYDLTRDLSFRGSYSTNFQAPPETLGAEGDIQGSTYIASLFRSVNTTTRVVSGITPEEDKAINLGVIWQPELFGGQLRASLDFWEIVIAKEVGSTSSATVFNNVFRNPTTGAPVGAPAAGTVVVCSSPYINFLTFSEPCNDTAPLGTDARTTAADLTNVFFYTLNTGGFIENGVDFQVDYRLPVGPGEFSVGANGTRVLVYKSKGYSLPDGTFRQPDFDGLGWANLTRGGTIMPEWRANAYLGYTLGDHRFRLRANYISGFRDDTGSPLGTAQTTVVAVVNGVNQFPTYGTQPSDYLDFDFNYVYTAPFWKDLQFRFSVLNLADEDPMPSQHTNAFVLGASDNRTGYYPGYGNPRGRQIEIGITKTF